MWTGTMALDFLRAVPGVVRKSIFSASRRMHQRRPKHRAIRVRNRWSGEAVRAKHWTSLIAAALFLGGAGFTDAQEYSQLSAPPFGIEFDPDQVRFERAPDEVYKCKELSERRGLVFVFGKVERGEAHYYLLSGWVRVEADSSGAVRFEDESDDGIIAVVSPRECHIAALGYAFSSERRDRRVAEDFGFSDQIIGAMIDDAVETQIHTFGGRDNFLCQPAIAQSPWPWPPQLQRKLDQLGKPTRPCK